MQVLTILHLFCIYVLPMMLCAKADSMIVASNDTIGTGRPGYAEISWQSLLLLLPARPRDCHTPDLATTLYHTPLHSNLIDTPAWLRRQPDEPVGRCGARFRLQVDAGRVWPRAFISTECVCEGSRCAGRGAHRCVTVHIMRTVLLRTGKWRREAIPAGCLCAAQKANNNSLPPPPITN